MVSSEDAVLCLLASVTQDTQHYWFIRNNRCKDRQHLIRLSASQTEAWCRQCWPGSRPPRATLQWLRRLRCRCFSRLELVLGALAFAIQGNSYRNAQIQHRQKAPSAIVSAVLSSLTGWRSGACVNASQTKMRAELRFTFCKWLLKDTQTSSSKQIIKVINASVTSLGHFVDLAHFTMYCTSTHHPLPALSSRCRPANACAVQPDCTPNPSIPSASPAVLLHQRPQMSKPPSASMPAHSPLVIRISLCDTKCSNISSATLGIARLFCISVISHCLLRSNCRWYLPLRTHLLHQTHSFQPPQLPRHPTQSKQFHDAIMAILKCSLFSHYSPVLIRIYPPTPSTPPCVMLLCSALPACTFCTNRQIRE